MSDINRMLLEALAIKEKLDAELQSAFLHPDTLRSKMRSDAAELLACIGGYAVPIERQARLNWITNMMQYDAMFVSKVAAITNMVADYTAFSARRQQTVPACLESRQGLSIEQPETNALAKDLGQLAAHHNLRGAVLVSFAGDRIGVNSCGEGIFGPEMDRLASRILAAIDDGQFDPPEVCEICRGSGVVAVVTNAVMTGDTNPCWNCKGKG